MKVINKVSIMKRPLVSVLTVLILVMCPEVLFGAHQGPPKAKWGSIKGDYEKKHEEIITSGSHTYRVKMAGKVDGVMTRMPISYGAYYQGWQPNRFIRLENIGDTDVVNPWIIVNGKRNWRTLNDIAKEAIGGSTIERDKARSIWEFQRNHRFHATTWGKESNDAVKVYNIYGYTLCGNDAQVISDLWRAAGLRTRRGYPVGHSVAEAFYNGEYHLLDGDEHAIYLRRDNLTIASEAEVVRDHDLVKRTHTYGIDRQDSRATDEFSASLYGYEGKREGELGGHTNHTMAYILRPGESMEWRWDHIGKQYTAGTEAPDGKWHKDGEGDLAVWGKRAYENMRNGVMRYVPNLEDSIYRKGVESESNIAVVWEDGIRPAIHPLKTGQTARIIWRIASAYVIVGGKIQARFHRASAEDLLRIKLSRDGKSWDTLWTAQTTGDFYEEVVLDDKLSPRGFPQYEYFLQIEMATNMEKGDVGVDRIEFITDVQMSLLGLPELELGENQVRYTDETEEPRRIRIIHSWMERTAWSSPSIPHPMVPSNGATVEGTLVKFSWRPPDSSGSSEVEDYHFQLSGMKDMRWPLSPNFDKLISKTASRGKEEWIAPCIGLLNPDTDYYWRVRAKNADGVWGPWSEVSSFKCAAPGVPINLRTIVDENAGTVILIWEANPRGRRPVKFKIYGSNEKGFTVSDTEYLAVMGRGFCRNIDDFNSRADIPSRNLVMTTSNFMTATKENNLMVVGPELSLPNANRAFYRVVAVDENGNESGASDYADFHRPFIYSRFPEKVKAGTFLTHEPGLVTSIGDLKCKQGYKAAFWDKESLSFSLVRAPHWLKINPQTGRISGTAGVNDLGKHEVLLRVINNKGSVTERRLVLEVTER
jgi:hypothetical protein